MSSRHDNHCRLERLLAVLLRYGTWLACAVIVTGLAWALVDGHVPVSSEPAAAPTHLLTAGIALFMLLPIVRVMVMAIAFAVDRDYLFVGIATLVLAIIGLGLALAAG